MSVLDEHDYSPLPVPIAYIGDANTATAVMVMDDQDHSRAKAQHAKRLVKSGLMADVARREATLNHQEDAQEHLREQARKKRVRMEELESQRSEGKAVDGLNGGVEPMDEEDVSGKDLYNFKPKANKGWSKDKERSKSSGKGGLSKSRRAHDSDPEDEDDVLVDEDASIHQEEGALKEGYSKAGFGLGKAQMNARGYFATHADSPVTTSDNTLKSFKPITHQEVNRIVLKERKHKDEIERLTQRASSMFNAWTMAMVNQSSVLVCGLGSKRDLLVRYSQQELAKYKMVYVLGYHPDITVGKILNQVLTEMFGYTEVSRQPADQLALIKRHFRQESATLMATQYNVPKGHKANFDASLGEHLFLIIHNIDGVGIRSKKDQALLAELARESRVHLIASIDHVHASYLWDEPLYTKFNFKIFEASTFAPYVHECEFEHTVMVQQESGSTRAALATLRSLNPNSQAIFKVLAKYQLENCDDHDYSGMTFKSYYDKCKSDFVTSNENSFQQRINEFTDHKIIKTRKNRDGNICFIVNMDVEAIEQILIGLDNQGEAD